MKYTYKSEQKVSQEFLEIVPKEVVEKRIVMEFLQKIPFEGLKQLVNLKEIDFKNSELWRDKSNYEMLCQLQNERAIKYTCELDIDLNQNGK